MNWQPVAYFQHQSKALWVNEQIMICGKKSPNEKVDKVVFTYFLFMQQKKDEPGYFVERVVTRIHPTEDVGLESLDSDRFKDIYMRKPTYEELDALSKQRLSSNSEIYLTSSFREDDVMQKIEIQKREVQKQKKLTQEIDVLQQKENRLREEKNRNIRTGFGKNHSKKYINDVQKQKEYFLRQKISLECIKKEFIRDRLKEEENKYKKSLLRKSVLVRREFNWRGFVFGSEWK